MKSKPLRDPPVDLMLDSVSVHVRDGVVVVDREGKILHFNERFASLSGYCRSSLVGRSAADLVAESQRDQVCDWFRNAAQVNGAQPNGQTRVLTIQTINGGSLTVNSEINRFVVRGEPFALVTLRDHNIETALKVELTRQMAERGSLATIGAKVASNPDISSVFSTAALEIRKLIDFDRLTITLTEPGSELLEVVHVEGIQTENYRVGTKIPDVVNAGHPSPIPGCVLMSGTETLNQREFIGTGLMSWAQVPLGTADAPVGYLSIRSRDESKYGMRELDLLRAIADQIAPSVKNSILLDMTRRASAYQASLARIGRIFSSSLTLDEIFPRFVNEVNQLIPVERAELAWLNGDSGHLQIAAAHGVGVPDHYTGAIRIRHPRDCSRKILVLGPDEIGLESKSAGIRSVINIPLISEDSLIGTLELGSQSENAYAGESVDFASMVGEQISGAMTAIRLHDVLRDNSQLQATLAAAGRVLSSSLILEDVFEPFVNSILPMIPFDRASISWKGTSDNSCEVAAHWGVRVDGFTTGNIGHVPLLSSVAENGLIVDQSQLPEEFLAAGLNSALIVGLFFDNKLMGTLNVASRKKSEFDVRHLKLLQSVAAQITGTVAAARLYEQTLELSEARELATRLEFENTRLQSEIRFKQDLLSVVSHELRTPLTSIMAFAEILGKDPVLANDSRKNEQIAIIQKSSRMLFLLIDDLLTASKIEAGKMALDIQQESISDIAKDVHRMFSAITSAKHQLVRVNIVGDNDMVEVDRLKFMQVICNLVSNASKYSSDGTEIKVDLINEPSCLTVEVTDYGIGISTEDQKSLFKTYFRADNHATRSKKGSGLGLFIVKSIVDMHRGEIELASRPGEGSVFTVRIPQPASGQQQRAE